MNRYGTPPEFDQCREASVPENLVVKMSQTTIPPGSEGMHSWIGKPVSEVAVARQLNRAYDFASDGPVRVKVPGYGWFLLGQEGWCVHK